MNGTASLDDVLAPTGWSNLAFLPAGAISPVSRPVTARSETLREVIEQLNQRYDQLVLDIPAILATNDAVPLASLATAVCLVIYQGATTVTDAQRALGEIDHLPIVGTILNRASLKTPSLIMKFVPA